MAEGVGSLQNCSGLVYRNEGRSLEHRWNAQKFEYPFGGRFIFGCGIRDWRDLCAWRVIRR